MRKGKGRNMREVPTIYRFIYSSCISFIYQFFFVYLSIFFNDKVTL